MAEVTKKMPLSEITKLILDEVKAKIGKDLDHIIDQLWSIVIEQDKRIKALEDKIKQL